jgi:SNF2 family DNA or RNA helicase
LCNKFQQELRDRGWTIEDYLASGSAEGDKNLFVIRKELARSRILPMLEQIDLAEMRGERVLVFSSHREPIEVLSKRKGWEVIHGGITSNDRRTKTCSDFRAGLLAGVGVTTASGQFAIDLSGAERVFFVDKPWNPGPLEQAVERASGPRQTNPFVVVFMVSQHPVDLLTDRHIESKSRIIKETWQT